KASEGKQEIWIDIIDNGPGFSEDVLQNLWTNVNYKSSKYKDSSVGLRNVHERIRIRFGAPYGMMICSSAGHGSVIRIRVPKLIPTQDNMVIHKGGFEMRKLKDMKWIVLYILILATTIIYSVPKGNSQAT